MYREDYYYSSFDGVHMIHASKWYPDKEIKAVLQIIHGMSEYIERYEDFASYLTSYGFLVAGEDHLGHGKSIKNKDDLGYFGEDGNRYLIGDIRSLYLDIKEKYDHIPYVFLGHSMGSFLLRQYIENYQDLDAAIIMGTGMQSDIALNFGIKLISLLEKKKGSHYRSNFIKALAFGSYNSKTEKKSAYDWLSYNRENIDGYLKDYLCNFDFTLNGYKELFKMIKDEQDINNLIKIKKDLPILLISGEDDPVGNYAKAVLASYNLFKEIGLSDVAIKIYPHMRHEILNENNKEEVYAYIINWLKEKNIG